MKRKYVIVVERPMPGGPTPHFLAHYEANASALVWNVDVHQALRMSLKNAQIVLQGLGTLYRSLYGITRPQIARLQWTLAATPTVAAYQPLKEYVG